MKHTTIGQLLIDRALPKEMQGRPISALDKKGVANLFQEIADKHPDQYRETAKRLSDVGRDVAYRTGGMSFSLDNLQQSPTALAARDAINRSLADIQADRQLSLAERKQRIIAAVTLHTDGMADRIYEEALKSGNPLATQILSGARGSKDNLKALIGFDGLYANQRGEPIAVPVLSSFSQGLKPHEYFASSFGARKSVIDTKMSTANAGFFSKQIGGAAHRLVVTAEDSDEEPTTVRGLPVSTSDKDSIGALLAADAGPYVRNTLITPRVLSRLASEKIDRILVRSPAVGGPRDGVYSRDAGVRDRGGLSPRGDFVGSAASQALAEKLTQGQLNSKHGGGVAGAAKAVSGFKHINALIQNPAIMLGAATHAEIDGSVAAIEDAPQGGSYVIIAGKKHYVPPEIPLMVKVGDVVDAGDELSIGIPHPGRLVETKGIGEGRRRFIEGFTRAFRESGMSVARRNVEMLARGLIDHVSLTAEHGDGVPGDIVAYHAIENDWTPRVGSNRVAPNEAAGKYLEEPVLHHTIGTKVTKPMIADMQQFGVENVAVHTDPPPFKPIMIRAMANLEHDPDWMTRHLGSNLQRGFLDAAHRGLSSDSQGSSFVPAVADRANFGRQGLTKGWRPSDIRPVDRDSDGFVFDGTPRERRVDAVDTDEEDDE